MVTMKANGKAKKTGRSTSRVEGKAAMGNVITEGKGRVQALERTLTQIERTFGKGSIMRLESDARHLIPGISTGALSLDLALG
ncbi:MAG: recombinase RecA, partial [Planctomycetota bacterium]